MLKGVDLQMISFVGISLIQDYLTFKHFPRIYFWNVEQQLINDDEHSKKSA
ncbi:hypothetical protein [Alkalihalobacterium alkalinitrilicum]|uniref:hypothetical protein n=1 Tax=Alkalihalobacterium alkalinitrilicum TaxID=427920 RepID=UPI001302FA81|nr:hypothetical protein [Alkalihalobacterium alkalinitrilicum]